MPSLRDIRSRIRQVKGVAQITKAMETVSASRLRRATERVTASRPFVLQLEEVLADLASATSDGDAPPLLAKRPVKNSAVILITPSRGLAGSLVSNVNRQASHLVEQEHIGAAVEIIAVGKKGRDFMSRRGQQVIAEFVTLPDRPALSDVSGIANLVIDGYSAGDFDRVSLVYTRFISTVAQRPAVKQLLPVEPPTSGGRKPKDPIYEPNAGEVLNALLPRYVETLIFQAILESIASEHAARMVAMRNATDNANDLISDLTLTYNKVRQATITREISEISSGAEAMANA